MGAAVACGLRVHIMAHGPAVFRLMDQWLRKLPARDMDFAGRCYKKFTKLPASGSGQWANGELTSMTFRTEPSERTEPAKQDDGGFAFPSVLQCNQHDQVPAWSIPDGQVSMYELETGRIYVAKGIPGPRVGEEL